MPSRTWSRPMDSTVTTIWWPIMIESRVRRLRTSTAPLPLVRPDTGTRAEVRHGADAGPLSADRVYGLVLSVAGTAGSPDRRTPSPVQAHP